MKDPSFCVAIDRSRCSSDDRSLIAQSISVCANDGSIVYMAQSIDSIYYVQIHRSCRTCAHGCLLHAFSHPVCTNLQVVVRLQAFKSRRDIASEMFARRPVNSLTSALGYTIRPFESCVKKGKLKSRAR